METIQDKRFSEAVEKLDTAELKLLKSEGFRMSQVQKEAAFEKFSSIDPATAKNLYEACPDSVDVERSKAFREAVNNDDPRALDKLNREGFSPDSKDVQFFMEAMEKKSLPDTLDQDMYEAALGYPEILDWQREKDGSYKRNDPSMAFRNAVDTKDEAALYKLARWDGRNYSLTNEDVAYFRTTDTLPEDEKRKMINRHEDLLYKVREVERKEFVSELLTAVEKRDFQKIDQLSEKNFGRRVTLTDSEQESIAAAPSLTAQEKENVKTVMDYHRDDRVEDFCVAAGRGDASTLHRLADQGFVLTTDLKTYLDKSETLTPEQKISIEGRLQKLGSSENKVVEKEALGHTPAAENKTERPGIPVQMRREILENGQHVAVLTLSKEEFQQSGVKNGITVSLKSQYSAGDHFLTQNVSIPAKAISEATSDQKGNIQLLAYEKVAGGEMRQMRELAVGEDTSGLREKLIAANPQVVYTGKEEVEKIHNLHKTPISDRYNFSDVYNKMNAEEKGKLDAMDSASLKKFIDGNSKVLAGIEPTIKKKEYEHCTTPGSRVKVIMGETEFHVVSEGLKGERASFVEPKSRFDFDIKSETVSTHVLAGKEVREAISKESFRDAINKCAYSEKETKGEKVNPTEGVSSPRKKGIGI